MKKKIIAIVLIIIAIIGIAVYNVQKNIKEKGKDYTIEEIKEYKYFESKAKDEQKFGIIDQTGKQIIPESYDDIRIANPEKAVFVCAQGEKTTVKNEENKEIYTEYENVDTLRLKNVSTDLVYEKSTLKYQKDGKYGLISIDGKKLTDAIYEEIDTLQYKEGELLVKKDGKYGIINKNGNTLIEAKYDKISADTFFENDNHYRYDGYIVANKTDEGYRYGYISYNGKAYTELKYNAIERVTDLGNRDEAYLLVAENGRYGILKNEKQIVQNDYQSITYDNSNKIFIVQKGKKYGVLNVEGKEILASDFTQIDIQGKYLYAEKEDGTTNVYSTEGKLENMDINTIVLDVPSKNRYTININTENNETVYQIYKEGTPVSTEKYKYISYLTNDLFIASRKDEKLGIIDSNAKPKTDFNYTTIQVISDTELIQLSNSTDNTVEIMNKNAESILTMKNATIEKEGIYVKIANETEKKYITLEGKEISSEEVLSSNTLFASVKDGKWGFVDKSGNVKVSYQYDKVTEFNEYGFAGILKDKKWGVLNKDGSVLIEPTYNLGTQAQPSFIANYYMVDRCIFCAVQVYIKSHIQDNSRYCCHRGSQSDLGKICIWLYTHKICQWQTYQKCLDQSLDHYPDCLVISIEIANHTEQDCCHYGFRCKAFQIVKCITDNFCICGENTSQHITFEHNQYKYHTSHSKPYSDSCKHGLFCSFFLARSYVLGYKGCHRLHQRTWYQHGEVNDFAGNPVAGRSLQSQTIYECTERKEGNLCQTFLQCKRKSDLKKSFALYIQPEVFFCDRKRKFHLNKQDKCEYHAKCLSCNCRNGSSGCIHMKSRYQHQISDHIYNTCHQHKQKRRFTVTQSTKNCRQQVVSYNKENTAATDTYITGCKTDG